MQRRKDGIIQTDFKKPPRDGFSGSKHLNSNTKLMRKDGEERSVEHGKRTRLGRWNGLGGCKMRCPGQEQSIELLFHMEKNSKRRLGKKTCENVQIDGEGTKCLAEGREVCLTGAF